MKRNARMGWGRGGLVAMLGFASAQCSSNSEPPAAPAPQFIEMPGLATYAMIIPADMSAAAIEPAAKEKCGSNAMCDVFAWSARAYAARALPMTDAEAAALKFHYKLNRNTGFEQSLWNCAAYPQPGHADCLDLAPPK